MTSKEYCTAFCEGYFYAQLGEKLTNGKVTDRELDLAKETARRYIEQQIAYSVFDSKQKQENGQKSLCKVSRNVCMIVED